MFRRPTTLIVLMFGILLAASTLAAEFVDGDLYLFSQAVPDGGGGSMFGLVKIDPLTGVSSLIYAPDTVPYPQFVYDRYRDLLVFAQADSGIVGIDADGTTTILAQPLLVPNGMAAKGDGIIYFRTGVDFYYLDAANNIHPVLDVTGAGNYSEGSGSVQIEIQYDAGTNSLIVMTEDGNLGPCAINGGICVAKIPLLPGGTQVAGPLTGATVDVSDSPFEQVVGSGYRDSGDIVFVVDTNANDAEPRLQLLDPATMALTTFATTGYYAGAAVISAGTFSNVLGLAVYDDSFNDVIRGFAEGTSGSGVIVADNAQGWGFSVSGHSEIARMVEIDKPIGSAVLSSTLKTTSRLHAPRPNPFNPRTTLRFELDTPGWARLDIYDVRGAHVRSLLAAEHPAGPQQTIWNGRDDAGRRVVSGVYFAKLAVGAETHVQRLVLLE